MNCFPVKVKAAAAAAFFPFVPLPSVAIEGHSFSPLSLPLSPWVKAREGVREIKRDLKKDSKKFPPIFLSSYVAAKNLELGLHLEPHFSQSESKIAF